MACIIEEQLLLYQSLVAASWLPNGALGVSGLQAMANLRLCGMLDSQRAYSLLVCLCGVR